MALTFYAAPNSTASVTEAVLAELGVAHERIDLSIGPDGTQSAAFRAVNPNGRVPTLVHDGVAIWESAAITIHLGETFGVAAGLFPPAALPRAKALSWTIWCSVNLAEAGGRIAAAMDPAGPGAVEEGSADLSVPDAHAAERARADIAGLLAILDGAVGAQRFLCGSYGLADTHVAVVVGWLRMMQVEVGAFPNVNAWLRCCSSRPALAWVA